MSTYGTALGVRVARKHIGWYLETSGREAASVKAWRAMEGVRRTLETRLQLRGESFDLDVLIGLACCDANESMLSPYEWQGALP